MVRAKKTRALEAEPPRRPPGWHNMNENEKLRLVREWEATMLPARMRPAPRRCLSCREDFESASAGNRLCDRCKAAA